MERTFAIIKPDAVAANQAGEIIAAMQDAGITVCSTPAEIGEKVQSRL